MAREGRLTELARRRRRTAGAATTSAQAASRAADVRVHVASFNTRAASELCIRSMRQHAGMPFALTVGDSGSTDGSREMLAALEMRNWLDLEVEPGRQHADWLDEWIRRDHGRYAVFCDSDIQFLRPGWLKRLVTTAEVTGAVVVYTEHLREAPYFGHPRTHEVVRLAERPAPWLFLVSIPDVREVGVSFAEHLERCSDHVPEGVIAYDVGARFFSAVDQDGGRALVRMPRSFRRWYRHYGGLSWVFDGDWGRHKARQRRLAARRLQYVRLRDDGHRRRAAVLGAATELGAGASFTTQKLRSLRHPKKVARRISGLVRSRAR